MGVPGSKGLAPLQGPRSPANVRAVKNMEVIYSIISLLRQYDEYCHQLQPQQDHQLYQSYRGHISGFINNIGVMLHSVQQDRPGQICPAGALYVQIVILRPRDTMFDNPAPKPLPDLSQTSPGMTSPRPGALSAWTDVPMRLADAPGAQMRPDPRHKRGCKLHAPGQTFYAPSRRSALPETHTVQQNRARPNVLCAQQTLCAT